MSPGIRTKRRFRKQNTIAKNTRSLAFNTGPFYYIYVGDKYTKVGVGEQY